MLKIYGIVLGIIFGCFAIMCLPTLGINGLWGVLMFVAYVWNLVICFMLAFCCKRQYGKYLIYALADGAILKLISQIIVLQYYDQIVDTSSLSVIVVIITIFEVVLCCYLMKAGGMIFTQNKNHSDRL